MIQMVVLLFSFLCLSVSVGAEEVKKSTDSELDSFQIVWTRNIFNPNRRPPPSAASLLKSATVEVTDRISLLGAAIHDGEAVAFFDGNKAEYRKEAKQGDVIAGYRLAAIATDVVKMVSGEEQIDLPVGMGLSRKKDGKWEIASGSRPTIASRSTANSASEPIGVGERADRRTGNDSNNDALRRLRDQRERERKR